MTNPLAEFSSSQKTVRPGQVERRIAQLEAHTKRTRFYIDKDVSTTSAPWQAVSEAPPDTEADGARVLNFEWTARGKPRARNIELPQIPVQVE